jgi:N-acetylneuraminate synthase
MSVTIIAEAGVNHDGDLDRALALVDAAAASGADVVKFQTFRAAALVTGGAPKADYQKRTTDGAESQLAMLQRLELGRDAHLRLLDRCRQRNIAFLSTPFDRESLVFLTDELGCRTLKFSSGDLTNGPLLHLAASRGAAVILSTGMATLDEVADALGVLALGYLGRSPAGTDLARADLAGARAEGAAQLAERVTLMHCTTEYPAPVAEVNLRAMQTLRDAFGLPVGYSDHTEGIAVSLAAAALGAVTIEKHFTLDRTLPGPDHKASIEPDQLAALVRGVTDVALALGSPIKGPTPSERANMAVARKSLVALRPIAAGQPFDEANLGIMRPGTGASPMQWWGRLGQPAGRTYAAGEVIE